MSPLTQHSILAMDQPPHSPDHEDATPLDLGDLDYEARVQLAVTAINASPLLPSGYHQLSLRAAASIYGVKRGTLDNRLKGMKTRQESHAHERLLSEAEEEVLVDWVKSLGRRGLPATADMLREYASVCWQLLYLPI